MAIELNTLSPKKFVANYGGVVPSLDASDGINNGDIAIDNSITPNKFWFCESNIEGSPVWETLNRTNVASITNTYTVTTNDCVLLANSTSSEFTITLPVAASNTGLRIYIKKVDNSANAITIDANGSETIDGELVQYINAAPNCMEIICDGSNWYII